MSSKSRKPAAENVIEYLEFPYTIKKLLQLYEINFEGV